MSASGQSIHIRSIPNPELLVPGEEVCRRTGTYANSHYSFGRVKAVRKRSVIVTFLVGGWLTVITDRQFSLTYGYELGTNTGSTSDRGELSSAPWARMHLSEVAEYRKQMQEKYVVTKQLRVLQTDFVSPDTVTQLELALISAREYVGRYYPLKDADQFGEEA